jgi:hypothetical protein
MSNDAIERLRDWLAISPDGIMLEEHDARAILDHITALTAERDAALKRAEKAEAVRDAAIVALAGAQEKIDELRDNETWRKIHNG